VRDGCERLHARATAGAQAAVRRASWSGYRDEGMRRGAAWRPATRTSCMVCAPRSTRLRRRRPRAARRGGLRRLRHGRRVVVLLRHAVSSSSIALAWLAIVFSISEKDVVCKHRRAIQLMRGGCTTARHGKEPKT